MNRLSKNITKDNSRKSGYAADRKAQLRKDAEVRNAKYQALSLEDKMKRQCKDGKVWNKLVAQL